jgi:mono/diheme cytochrome c family protein
MQVKWIIRLLVFVMVLIAGVACTGLSSEPEIVSTLPPQATARPETFDARVNLNQGARVFAENCVRCHGISGKGDGEFALSGQVQNVPDFTDPLKTQDKSLQEWFDAITNGNLDALMPPWRDKLSAKDRWAVALYTYTLAYDTTAVTLGQNIYDTQCAECHTEDGSGSDNGASLILELVALTERNLQDTISAHHDDLQLPAVTDNDLNAVSKYVRLLSSESHTLPDPHLVLSSQPEPVTTEEVVETVPQAQATQAISETIGILRGTITQGTEGGGQVDGLEAILHIYDSQLREQIAEYTVGADGTYQYDEVVFRSDFAYLMTVEYKGVTYSSGVYIGDPTQNELVIDVAIYETGADISALEITSWATQVNLSAQGLYIIEVIDMVNRSNQAYIRDSVDNVSKPVSVGFALPENAQIQSEHTNSNRLIVSDDGRTILDTTPVLPNSEHYVQYSYLLPIENARDIQQSVDYKISGPIAFYVENSHLDLTGNGIELVKTLSFNNQEYNLYEVSQTPTVGQTVSYDVVLRDPSQIQTSDEKLLPREVLAIIVLVVGLMLVASAMFIIWRGRNSVIDADISEDITAEMIMEQIAELDNKFDAGEIEKPAYQKQRNQLKSRLMQVMKAQGADS